MCLHIQMTGTDCWHQGYTMRRLRHPESQSQQEKRKSHCRVQTLFCFRLCSLPSANMNSALRLAKKKITFTDYERGSFPTRNHTNNWEKECKFWTTIWNVHMHTLSVSRLCAKGLFCAMWFDQQSHSCRRVAPSQNRSSWRTRLSSVKTMHDGSAADCITVRFCHDRISFL